MSKLKNTYQYLSSTFKSFYSNKFFFRFLTTTMSVSLAFLVDRTYENYKANSQFKKALFELHLQNEQNSRDIDTSMASLKILRPILYKARKDTSITLMEIASEPPYVSLPTIKTGSLSRFINNPNVDFDFELISLLSDIENAQIDLLEMSNTVRNTLYSPETNEHSEKGNLQKQLMNNLVGSAIHREMVLKDVYQEFEDYLKKKKILK
jgi:hypothetical protein